MAVQAIFRYVQFAANKPLGKGSFPFQDRIPFLSPEEQFGGLFAPETFRILDRLLIKIPILLQARDRSVLNKRIGWLKDPSFYQERLNRIAHGKEGILRFAIHPEKSR